MEKSTKSCFEELELLDVNSTYEQIKANYKRLSIKNKDNPERLVKLEAAYTTLYKDFEVNDFTDKKTT